MRIFKYRSFSSWSKTENLTDASLISAVQEITNGLFEANLGGGLYKKRVAREKVRVSEEVIEHLLPINRMIELFLCMALPKMNVKTLVIRKKKPTKN